MLRRAFEEVAETCFESESNPKKTTAKRASSLAATMINLGRSVEGVEIFALRVVSGSARKEGADDEEELNRRPSFAFIGNMHGDEPVGREIALQLAKWACVGEKGSLEEATTMTSFGNVEEIAKKVKTKATLYFLPTLNPDGFARRRRENANGIDLNRDFPYIEFSKPKSKSRGEERVDDLLDDTLRVLQPETKSLVDFSKKVNLTGAVNYHEGALVANYPWDGNADGSTKYSKAPDDKIFKNIASKYATSHGRMKKSKEFANGITNGAQWYPLWGGMQDWHYVKTQTLDFTIEVNDKKWPPEDLHLSEIIHSHCRASIDAAHEVMFVSTRGFVLDASTNAPIEKCEVRVDNLASDHDSRENNATPLPVFTNKVGFFVKPVFVSVRDISNSFKVAVTCPESKRVHHEVIKNLDAKNGVEMTIRVQHDVLSASDRNSNADNDSNSVDDGEMGEFRISSSPLSFSRATKKRVNGSDVKNAMRQNFFLFGTLLLLVLIFFRGQRRRLRLGR